MQALRAAPPLARVCVVGSCMEPDTVMPLIPQAKQLTVIFSFAYDPFEFGDTLRAIAETGVDRISVGALTHSVQALDIALDYDLGPAATT